MIGRWMCLRGLWRPCECAAWRIGYIVVAVATLLCGSWKWVRRLCISTSMLRAGGRALLLGGSLIPILSRREHIALSLTSLLIRPTRYLQFPPVSITSRETQ